MLLKHKALIAIGLLLSACNDGSAMLALNSEPIKLSYHAKDAKLSGVKGPFMLFFYSKDCGVCDKQIPILNELKNDIKIIGVLGGVNNIAKAKENAKGVEFATVFEPNDVEYLSNIVGGIWGVPAMFFYDAHGKMVKKYISLTPKSELKKEINLLH